VLTLICHQIGIAIQNARLYAEVEEKEEISARLVEKVISAQEEERRRLASELHDETGQALTGITLSLEALGTTLPSEMKTARQQLRSMQHVTQDALGELRKMVLALRPSALDDLGLVPAVRRYAQQYLESAGMTVTIDADGSSPALEPSIETMVFRVVQEAINNAARHSKASHVAIRFWQRQQEFYVEVEDNGVGFEPEAVSRSSKPSASLGLLGMHERANLVNGRVTIHSQPAHGTKVLVCVPNRVRGSSA
jgi:two-component system sensor histidine kinase UhpB